MRHPLNATPLLAHPVSVRLLRVVALYAIIDGMTDKPRITDENFMPFYEQGHNDAQIAEIFGINRSNVSRRRKKLGLPPNKGKKPVTTPDIPESRPILPFDSLEPDINETEEIDHSEHVKRMLEDEDYLPTGFQPHVLHKLAQTVKTIQDSRLSAAKTAQIDTNGVTWDEFNDAVQYLMRQVEIRCKCDDSVHKAIDRAFVNYMRARFEIELLPELEDSK